MLSDFRSADWERPLIKLAQKNDLVAFRMTDDFDRALPMLGSVVFKDVESELKMVLPTSSAKLREEWKNRNESMQWRWQETCLKHGITPVLMNTGDDALQLLTSVFEAKK